MGLRGQEQPQVGEPTRAGDASVMVVGNTEAHVGAGPHSSGDTHAPHVSRVRDVRDEMYEEDIPWEDLELLDRQRTARGSLGSKAGSEGGPGNGSGGGEARYGSGSGALLTRGEEGGDVGIPWEDFGFDAGVECGHDVEGFTGARGAAG